jgi:4'-phosphopantetheinyl transferase
MGIYWLRQSEPDVPPGNAWLSRAEVERLAGIRFPKRSADWRLGRWTAKCAVAAYLGVPRSPQELARIELRPEPCGAPVVFISDCAAGVAVSLSHSAGHALSAVAPEGVALGCDLELIETREQSFVESYFTESEAALIEQTNPEERARLLALLWSAKESTLKAVRTGLRQDTRSVEVSSPGVLPCQADEWQQLQVRYLDKSVYCGWWRSDGRFVETLVAATPAYPLPLSVRSLDPEHAR